MAQDDEAGWRRGVVWIVLGLAVVALAGISLLVRQAMTAGGVVSGSVPPSQVAQEQAVLQPGTELEWSVQPATLGPVGQTALDQGGIFVLSTAPGAKDQGPEPVPQAIFTSTDGEQWEAQVLDQPWVMDIAAGGGRLYAVGTAPGKADLSAPPRVRLGLSTDGGGTFSLVRVPVSEGPPADAVVTSVWATTSVAATAEGTVVLVTTQYGIDPGNEGKPGDQVLRHEAFFTADGTSFEQLEYPFPANADIEDISPVGDDLVARLVTPSGSEVWRSSDGRIWSEVATPPGMLWIAAIGRVGDRLVTVGMGEERDIRLAVSAGYDQPWSNLAMDALLPAGAGEHWLSGAAVGEAGVVFGTSSTPSDESLVTRLFGEFLGEPGRRPVEEPDEARERAGIGGLVTGGGSGESVNSLYVSADLATWSISEDVDLAGVGEGLFDGMLVTPDRVLAHLSAFRNAMTTRVQATIAP